MAQNQNFSSSTNSMSSKSSMNPENIKNKVHELADEPKSYEEGMITKVIEKQTAEIPSGVYLTLAVGSMAASLVLALVGGKSKGWANFVGQWAPSFLILGLYNKLVKVHGSDSEDTVKNAIH